MYQATMVVPAPPDRVFPLLCPLREHDWLDGWRADVLRSSTGAAEPGCVFVSGAGAPAERCTWIVVEHAPPSRVVFTLVQPGLFAEVLAIDVVATADGGAALTWSRETTPLSPEGAAHVARRLAEADAKHAMIARALAHYLATGRCLSRAEEAA